MECAGGGGDDGRVCVGTCGRAAGVEVRGHALCLWLQAVDGTVTINGNDHDFGKSFSDLWDSLDFAAGLLGIVRHDRRVVPGQIDYASLDSDNENSSAPARLEVDQLFAVTAAGYEVQVAEGVALDVRSASGTANWTTR